MSAQNLSRLNAFLTRRHMIAGTAAFALASCGGTAPRDAFYRLGDAAAPSPLPGGPIKGVVDVPTFRAAGILNERAIVYRTGVGELAQYSYHHWFEPPGALIQRDVISVLRKAQAFDAVTSPELRLDRDYELIGNILRFEHIATATPFVAVEIEISLRRVRGNAQMILKTYTGDAPLSGNSVAAAVAAFARAMDMVFAALLADLAQLPKTASKTS